MEELKTERLKGSVRIRIEQPPFESPETLKDLQSVPLPVFYRILLVLTFPISALSLYLSFAP